MHWIVVLPVFGGPMCKTNLRCLLFSEVVAGDVDDPAANEQQLDEFEAENNIGTTSFRDDDGAWSTVNSSEILIISRKKKPNRRYLASEDRLCFTFITMSITLSFSLHQVMWLLLMCSNTVHHGAWNEIKSG